MHPACTEAGPGGEVLFRQVQDPYIAEFDSGAVSEETHMAFLVEHSRVVPVVSGIRVIAASVRSDIVPLAGFP